MQAEVKRRIQTILIVAMLVAAARTGWIFYERSREADQAIELVGDLSETHVNVGHALFVECPALGLHLLHFRLAALNLSHDNQRVL